MTGRQDPLELFKLKPVGSATVSEISEATALSPVPASEKVNFHIGNPVQDERLFSMYLRLILRMKASDTGFSIADLKNIADELGMEDENAGKLDFLKDLIIESAPYSPRGGFHTSRPNSVVQHFNDWLTKNQPEPLTYDPGGKSGKKEIILSSGGLNECLRILFHSISGYLINAPSNVYIFGIDLPDHLFDFPNIQFQYIDSDEPVLVKEITGNFNKNVTPSFLIIGKLFKEDTRRHLRNLSLQHPLFFIEVNDAPNHLSLAREAKMMNRVLRIITPGIFSSKLEMFSLVFVAGNADFIKVMETVHFQLKGTPSSTEIVLLAYLLSTIRPESANDADSLAVDALYGGHQHTYVFEPAAKYVISAENKLDALIRKQGERVDNTIRKISETVKRYIDKAGEYSIRHPFDLFTESDAFTLLNALGENTANEEWIGYLKHSYLTSFLHQHAEYTLRNCLVVSGSSRTALSLLGFHCGIREVIIPDLSWTYEHCFPDVYAIPLTEHFQLDIGNIKTVVREKLNKDSAWKKHGAVVLNNPHNATGQIFDKNDLRDLLRWLLEQEIFVIDDLSYQNVVPEDEFREIGTLRQISNELVREGYLTDRQADYVITVHSLSKTDSYAGARLSVVEIRHDELYRRFRKINDTVKPNLGAIYLAYLFYRNRVEDVCAYYRLRNKIFKERCDALVATVADLPAERNRFNIVITPPAGSMYPHLKVTQLPPGLSLDWLASGLARQGIGLIPLSTFARTEKGFDAARNSFRLTLGGTDNSDTLSIKTRRVLIDLNRMIGEESSGYNRKEFDIKPVFVKKRRMIIDNTAAWEHFEQELKKDIHIGGNKYPAPFNTDQDIALHKKNLQNEFLPYKLSVFKQRFFERQDIVNEFANRTLSTNGKQLSLRLEKEFYKDNLRDRQFVFRHRLYDRTVHPTQMYSIKTEILFENFIDSLIRNKQPHASLLKRISTELVKEYYGQNVPILSNEEPQELILDLRTMIDAEIFTELYSDSPIETFISFWGDWDGSNRPSGQGHSLVAFVLIENIILQARIIRMLSDIDKSVKIDPELLREIESLQRNNRKFSDLINKISHVTHQLEQRYRGILPFNLKPGKMRKLGMKLHLARDPLLKMWYHNDRLERIMLDLRRDRRKAFEYYFSLNKRLRKTLYESIPVITSNISHTGLLLETGLFRDLMKRFVVTPRINQNLITVQDQFAIDTTVHNIYEINEIAGTFGNPGMVLALQVSMTTDAGALISVDRKLRSRKEEIIRHKNNIELPDIWIVPLFEEADSVRGINTYLEKIWDYAFQSRRLNQATPDRFAEIITELFVAGSDVSQQVGQPMGNNLYLESKYDLTVWLASHNLTRRVRMKLGSGESMQRQGGYYSNVAGKPLCVDTPDAKSRLSVYLRESTRKSTEYARTPLLGIFAGSDLRTFQSNLSERLRYLPVSERSRLLYHIRESQRFHENEIIRACEPLSETRLQFKTRGLQELERLTVGKRDALYDDFLNIHKDNFRQILYGREEDVVGIHVISYFIGRALPQLRDRPTERDGGILDDDTGRKIIEKIARTIPLSSYGSFLRAIAHNQSQTLIMGINQLTTGLFRALNNFSRREFADTEANAFIGDRILPKLPVYEVLHSLRLYHDRTLTYVQRMEDAFPAGNSALTALREDIDSMQTYLPIFQKELLRRHGLDVSEFFDNERFIPDMLPSVRPDLAVLLQNDLFNTSFDVFAREIRGSIDTSWAEEVERLLKIPKDIRSFREKIWELLERPVFQRAASFVELAIALYPLTLNTSQRNYLFRSGKVTPARRFVRSGFDDTMQQFLSAAMEYLSDIAETSVEVPINVIRALKEIERLLEIEEQPLSTLQQDRLRFYLLQIARGAGENG
jgi:aspartate/methionine/tyrosine aminotransferase